MKQIEKMRRNRKTYGMVQTNKDERERYLERSKLTEKKDKDI